jgi:hypothetical protein
MDDTVQQRLLMQVLMQVFFWFACRSCMTGWWRQSREGTWRRPARDCPEAGVRQEG